MGSVSQSSAGGSFPFLRSEIRRSVRAQRRKERMQSAQPHADRFNVCESDPEVTSIRRAFGARKARRYLNELLLRDMEDASSWTVDDMNASFNPVPFGEPRRYPLTQIFEDEKTWGNINNNSSSSNTCRGEGNTAQVEGGRTLADEGGMPSRRL